MPQPVQVVRACPSQKLLQRGCAAPSAQKQRKQKNKACTCSTSPQEPMNPEAARDYCLCLGSNLGSRMWRGQAAEAARLGFASSKARLQKQQGQASEAARPGFCKQQGQRTSSVGTPHLWITAFQQRSQQARQQHCMLPTGSSAIGRSVGWQQAHQPGAVLVQDVANVLKGCLAHREGVVRQGFQGNSHRLFCCQAPSFL